MELMVEFEKVAKRQKSQAAESQSILDKLIQDYTNAKSTQDISKLGQVKESCTALTEAYKDSQTTLNKFGKAVEKKFKVDLDSIWDPQAFRDKSPILNFALAQHFIREGRFHIADLLAAEANLSVAQDLTTQFHDMFQIQESLKSRDLQLAIEWCKRHKVSLESRDSSLEFQLYKLKFIQLLLNTNKNVVIDYAKSVFPSFFGKHRRDISKLMTSILYVKNLESSPYKKLLFDSNQWVDVQSQFARDFCSLLGLASDSALYTALALGTSALPTIIKMSSIMKDKSGVEWSQQGEMPVEIPIPDACRFHSVFACPVSKEQSSDVNPAMMMACGHVISKESLLRVCKGNPNLRFKCPYCPIESTSAQAIRVYF